MSDLTVYDDQGRAKELTGDLSDLIVDIGARVYNSSPTTLTTNVFANLTFGSERWDTDNIHSTVSNTSRLTCKTAGKYSIDANIQFEPNAVGHRGAWFYLNGTTYIGGSSIGANTDSGISTTICISTTYVLAVDDYVEVRVRQKSGGDLDVEVSANISPEFMMQLTELATSVSLASFSGARYETDAGQAIGGSLEVIDFEDLIYDTDNAVTTGASWKYTAPVTGYYHLDCHLLFSATTGWLQGTRRGYIKLFINGVGEAALDRDDTEEAVSSYMALSGSITFYLSAGDYCDVRIEQNTGTDLDLQNDADFCWINIEKK